METTQPAHEQREAGANGGLAADEVGERAEEKLSEAEPEEEGGDDELHVVALRRAEIAPDCGQGGQHRVDRERDERHQEGDEGDELAGAEHGPPCRPPGRAGRLRHSLSAAVAGGSTVSGESVSATAPKRRAVAAGSAWVSR